MTPSVQRVLTGITTTGTPHLGNFVGAIRPAVAASRQPGVESFYFLADYHALIKCDDPARIQQSTLEIAATWLAAGLDPERVTFYRQSDIPEIPELTWLLTCVTGKGLLNRAHAYKAAVDRNLAAGLEAETDITAGLFMYPVLMGADILMFKAHRVPVGRDQIQHIEMARDMAQRFNYLFGEHLVLPEAAIEESVATLPGLDGRKMSKSYDNTIPLFVSPDELRRRIAGIVTDSRPPGEAKETEGSAVFDIFRAFASAAETRQFADEFADGIGWGAAKQKLAARIDCELEPMRDSYRGLMADPNRLEDILQSGAARARAIAAPFMSELRAAVGLRRLSGPTKATTGPAGQAPRKSAAPQFKQFRDPAGGFRFRLMQGSRSLLESRSFATGRDAAAAIAALQAAQGSEVSAQIEALAETGATSGDDAAAILQALRRLRGQPEDA